MSNIEQSYQNFRQQLVRFGLDLCACFDVSKLPDSLVSTLPPSSPLQVSSLVLVAGYGGSFWEYLVSSKQAHGHCFNRVSHQLVTQAFEENFPQLELLSLYPDTEYVIPLQQLGRLVGWGTPSVLGPDIHPEYGTWFAYRAALLVSGELPYTEYVNAVPVCKTCVDKPCQSVCPVGAVRDIGDFALNECMTHRMIPASSCADRCLARLACPVGNGYRYSQAQLVHHGKYSLDSIQRYQDTHEF